jgi:heme/copper-type cytochrome/quinol oxidase subunit 2
MMWNDRRAMTITGLCLVVVGFVGSRLGVWFNGMPMEEGTGADIGAGGLVALGTMLAIAGLVVLMLAGVLVALARRTPRG